MVVAYSIMEECTHPILVEAGIDLVLGYTIGSFASSVGSCCCSQVEGSAYIVAYLMACFRFDPYTGFEEVLLRWNSTLFAYLGVHCHFGLDTSCIVVVDFGVASATLGSIDHPVEDSISYLDKQTALPPHIVHQVSCTQSPTVGLPYWGLHCLGCSCHYSCHCKHLLLGSLLCNFLSLI